jgi:hypothetical protein
MLLKLGVLSRSSHSRSFAASNSKRLAKAHPLRSGLRRAASSVSDPGLGLLILCACLGTTIGTSASVPITTAVDVYLDMESGLSGAEVTTNLLNAATHGQGGWWSLFPDTLTEMTITSVFDQPLGGTVTVDGTAYSDAWSSRSIACQNSNTRQFARFTFDTSRAKVSMGCFLRLGNFTGSTFGSYDLITMEGNDGDFAVMNFQDFPGTEFVWEVHTQKGVGAPVRIVANKTYWVTMLWDQPHLIARLQVYDPANWTLVGSSSLTLQDQVCETICLGRYDDHPDTSPAYHYYDDLIVDLATAKFPLLPGRNPTELAPLALYGTGLGKVSGPANEALLIVGKTYTLTAYPAAGQLFDGWSGSVTSANPSLHFVMVSNFTVTASFVTNYFPHVKGTYNGLFLDPTNTEQQSSGYASLTVRDSGSYSGKILLNGRSYSLSGTLAPEGTAVQRIARRGTNALIATMTLDLTNGTDRLTGSISEEVTNTAGWSVPLELDHLVFSKTDATSFAGKYTIVLPPDPGSPEGPRGDGVGSMSVTPDGKIKFAGKLADGTKASQSTTLSKSGSWPFYVSLYSGKGSLVGSSLLDTNLPDSDLSGNLLWFKQAQPGARYSPAGFTNGVAMVGSSYRPPDATNAALNLTSGTLAFTNLELGLAFENQITLSPPATIANLSPNKISLSLSKPTGLFTGSVTPPSGGKAWPFSGVLLQKRTMGAGFLLGTNQSGAVLLH